MDLLARSETRYPTTATSNATQRRFYCHKGPRQKEFRGEENVRGEENGRPWGAYYILYLSSFHKRTYTLPQTDKRTDPKTYFGQYICCIHPYDVSLEDSAYTNQTHF